MKFTASLVAATTLVLALAGCYSGASVPSRRVGQVTTSRAGTVTEVRDVVIDGRRTIVGRIGGGGIGTAAAIGNTGVGTAGAVGVAAAGVVGMIGGGKVEEFMTRKRGQEITIQLDEGRTVTIVQEAPPEFLPGDRISLEGGNIDSRVRHQVQ